jgi:hypothetical protein
MNKTLIEIYNDGLGLYSSLCAVFEAIDSRLSAMEHPAPPVQSAVDWLHEIDDRLSALEKPAETDREWIPVGDGEIVWGAFKIRGSWRVKEMIRNALEPGDLWMPYREGDPKPEPPKGDK